MAPAQVISLQDLPPEVLEAPSKKRLQRLIYKRQQL
jgi:hypothetical protein